jgi:hypothetical protein
MATDPELLWPDDVKEPTDRDGVQARLGGKQRYFFSRNVLWDNPNLLAQHRIQLTQYIRENGGGEPVEFMTHNIEAALQRRPTPVREKVRRLLAAVARHADYQVRTLSWSGPEGLPFELCREAGLGDLPELIALLNYASGQGLVQFERFSGGAKLSTTVHGLMWIEEEGHSPAASSAAFVAMWFGAEMAAAYSDGIAPAIEANGYTAVRIDNREYNNKIDDEIVSEIRKARFVVADVSCDEQGARGGVYFEAGFALALGKPVIFTVRATDLPRVHFDTRQFNHIVWASPEELKTRLLNRIGATLGRRAEGL